MSLLRARRVVNTRAIHQAADLDRLLITHGAIPISYPCIAIAPPDRTAALDDAVQRLTAGQFEWLVLTSSNTVQALADRWPATPDYWKRTRLAAIGPSTAAAAYEIFETRPTIVPTIASGTALAEAIPVEPGDRVLIPGSDLARSEIAESLAARGAVVEQVVAYRTVVGSGGSDLPRLLTDGHIDALTFCSSSAVDGLVARLNGDRGPLDRAFELPAVCIGTPTEETARAHGFRSVTAATPQSLDGIIASLAETFATKSQGGSRWL